ncbi:hypothetical protein H6G33_09295 [Calothrix sp. FACHB-1219]|uniref:hypothetical protein n=1 Tax=unclassified Calothrix TaxID=2619626 RepID=UPI001685D084|nr:MULTISPECIES: hypothetical protein [unclassified Calothrix]MBD2201540.1 hypothetical protein [Calothrix sp. FACHB-168]MBD2217226.1 hypothetical protein [Calothrix sp. FACHB-1219]
MDNNEFLYLDSTSIQEDLLKRDLNSTEILGYRRQLNLSLVSSNSENRLRELSSILYESIKDKVISFTDLNKLIESYLILFLSTTYIGNIDNSKYSSHYYKRKLIVPNHFSPISEEYLEDLLYSGNKIWGGKYGSLLYYRYIQTSYSHYNHPSELVNSITNYIINSYSNNSNDKVSKFSKDFINLLLEDRETVDVDIYDYSFKIFKIFDLDKIIKILTYLQVWLPKAYDYYNLDVNEYLPNSSVFFAATILKRIVIYSYKLGIDSTSLSKTNLIYSFIHSELNPIFISLIDEIILIRKTLSLSQDSTNTPLELLVEDLYKNIDINISSSALKETSYYILSEFFPVGGYNQYLLILALSLLNRAYIITFPSNNVYKNFVVSPIKDFYQPALDLLGRVERIFYLAGYLLKKSNLDHLQILGSNLITMSSIEDDSSDAIYNLME